MPGLGGLAVVAQVAEVATVAKVAPEEQSQNQEAEQPKKHGPWKSVLNCFSGACCLTGEEELNEPEELPPKKEYIFVHFNAWECACQSQPHTAALSAQPLPPPGPPQVCRFK